LDGIIGRAKGAVLVGLYVLYVITIWIVKRQPPSLGEAGGVAEEGSIRTGKVTSGFFMILIGVAAMAAGSTLLVTAVQKMAHVKSSQTKLGLTLVGFATAFELIVLAVSAARHQASEAVVAAIVGSYAYNMTMTLGAAALVGPLVLRDASLLHWPLAAMLFAFALVLLLATPLKRLSRRSGAVLLAAYPVFIWLALRG
jgi:cation:H+ antiporter